MKLWLQIVALVLVFIIGFTGAWVLKPGSTVVQSGLSTAPATIKIGIGVDSTGYLASGFNLWGKLCDAWANWINARGGIYVASYGRTLPVKIVSYDIASTVSTCTTEYERMATVDNVNIMIGPSQSDFAIPASSVAGQYHIPFIDTLAGTDEEYDVGNNWIVGTLNVMPQYLMNYFNMLGAQHQAKTVAFVDLDSTFTNDVGTNGGEYYAKQNGLDVVYSTTFSGATTDFTSILTTLKSTNPDVVVFGTNIPPQMKDFITEMNQIGWIPKELAIYPVDIYFAAMPLSSLQPYMVFDTNSWWPNYPYNGAFGSQVFPQLLTTIGYSVENFTNEATQGLDLVYNALELSYYAIVNAGSLSNTAIMNQFKTMNVQTIAGDWQLQSFYEAAEGHNVVNVGCFQARPIQYINDQWRVIYAGNNTALVNGQHVYDAK